MLLAIFGAGASYDSVDLTLTPGLHAKVAAGYVHRLPLANELFEDREDFLAHMRNIPRIQPVVARLRAAGQKGDIEAELRRMLDETPHIPDRPAQLIAVRRYLYEVINEASQKWIFAAAGATNYAALVDQISSVKSALGSEGNWLTFVTFNYDTLLEAALQAKWNAYFNTMDAYRESNPPLIRPHGSVQWQQAIPGISLDNRGLGAEIYLGSQAMTDGLTPIHHRSSSPAMPEVTWVPAVAVPLAGKSEFVVPPSHLTELQRRLLDVTRVLVVGWRAQEEHFLDFLCEHARKDSPVELCAVDKTPNGEPSRAQIIAEHLTRRVGSVQWKSINLFDGGFSEFVRSGCFGSWVEETS